MWSILAALQDSKSSEIVVFYDVFLDLDWSREVLISSTLAARGQGPRSIEIVVFD